MDVRFESEVLIIDGHDYSDELAHPVEVVCTGDDYHVSRNTLSARYDQETRVLIQPQKESRLARYLAGNLWKVSFIFEDGEGQRWSVGGLYRKTRGDAWLTGPRLEEE